MAVRVLSAKLPQELIDALGPAAEARGLTRNGLVREALEAVLEGRIIQLTPRERLARDLRAGFARDRKAMKARSFGQVTESVNGMDAFPCKSP